MGLPMRIPAQDADHTRIYPTGGKKPEEGKELEGSGEDVDGVPMESSTKGAPPVTMMPGPVIRILTPAMMNGYHAPVIGNLYGQNFRVHQLRCEQQPAVPTAFLPRAAQLAPVRNGQLYQFPSQYGLKMWASVNIQQRPGVAHTRASVERAFWRQSYWFKRRRGRRRMLSDLDNHVRHNNFRQRSLRGATATPTLWSIASNGPTFDQTLLREPRSSTIFLLEMPRTRGLRNIRAEPSAFPGTPARTITYTLQRIQQLQDEQSLALREIELADLRAMRNWPRNWRPLATWEIAERERDLQMESIEIWRRMAERGRRLEYWGRSGPARRIGISALRSARLFRQAARTSRSLSPPLGDHHNSNMRQLAPLLRDQSDAGKELRNDDSKPPLVARRESPWALREYDEPEVTPAPAEVPPHGITPSPNGAPSAAGSGEEGTQASQPRPLIFRGGPGVPGGRTWAAGWSRQPLYVMRCIIQYFFASMDRWSRQPFYALRGVMRDYNYRSRATQAQAAILWECEARRIARVEAHMERQLATIDGEDVRDNSRYQRWYGMKLANDRNLVGEESPLSRSSPPTELRPAGELLQSDKTLIEPPKVQMRGGAPPWTWHPRKSRGRRDSAAAVRAAAASGVNTTLPMLSEATGSPEFEPEFVNYQEMNEAQFVEHLLSNGTPRSWFDGGGIRTLVYTGESLNRIFEEASKKGWEDLPQPPAAGSSQRSVQNGPNIGVSFVNDNDDSNNRTPSYTHGQPARGVSRPPLINVQQTYCTPHEARVDSQNQVSDGIRNSDPVDFRAVPKTEETPNVNTPGKNTRKACRKARRDNERCEAEARQVNEDTQENANEGAQETWESQEAYLLQESTPPSQGAATSAGRGLAPALPQLPSVASTLMAASSSDLDKADLNISMMRVPDLDLNLVNDNNFNLFSQHEKELFHKFLPCEIHWPHVHHPKLNTGDSEYAQVEEISVDQFNDYLEFLVQTVEEQWKSKGSNIYAVGAENLVCTGTTHGNHGKLLRGVDILLESLDRLEGSIAVGPDEKKVAERGRGYEERLMGEQERIRVDGEIATIHRALSGLVEILVEEVRGDEEGCGMKEADGGEIEGQDFEINSTAVSYDSDMELVNVAFEKVEKEVLSDEEIEEHRLRLWKEWILYVEEYMNSKVTEGEFKVIDVEDRSPLVYKNERDSRSLDPWDYRTPEKGRESESQGDIESEGSSRG
ncbi:hypothetical protein EV426DRAFT_646176 [Tirmania nivea]|nr:hypothetical protein EV426DRAFT_646176 [Tirmania nivea]